MPACVMDVVYGYDRVVVEGQSGVLDFLMTKSSCLCSKIQFLSSVQAKGESWPIGPVALQ